MFGKLRVPPGPILGALMMSGLALTLVVVIIYRSPYTHGNLSAEGYDRTDIIYVGDEQPYDGIGLTDLSAALSGDPVQDGSTLFFAYGCASCHGVKGEGSAVGPEIAGDSALKIGTKVREGPKTMPAYDLSVLSDADLEKLVAFLHSSDQ